VRVNCFALDLGDTSHLRIDQLAQGLERTSVFQAAAGKMEGGNALGVVEGFSGTGKALCRHLEIA